MPYIPEKDREYLAYGHVPAKPGELNFLISQIIRRYLAEQGRTYTTLNTVAGVLSCLSMEVYRRITAKYEDEKMSENGDVF